MNPVRYQVPIRSFQMLMLGIVILLSGCKVTDSSRSQSGPSADAFPNHSVQIILNQLPTFPEDLDRVQIEAKIAVASPELDGQITALVNIKQNDSLYASIKFPLGIEGARVLITKDSAFTYDRLQNTVFRATREHMKAVLPGAFLELDMLETLLGFVSPPPEIPWRKENDENRYYLYAPGDNVRYTIDPLAWRIEQIQYRNPDGTVVEQRWYQDFKNVEGVQIPSRVILVQAEESTRLLITLQNLTKNPSPFRFDLNVRADTKWKDLTP